MSLDYKELCVSVCELARETGQYIASERETFSFADVEFKGDQNMVSYVDKQAEKMVVERLRELTPDAGFITEEGTAIDSGERLKWIIDPLDGTTNFIHGLPPYCVSIGLMEGDEMVVGVVYEITLREMFYAWKGSDAYLNGRVIKVSETKKLTDSLVAIGFSYNTISNQDNYINIISDFQRDTNGIRRLGSSTADIVYTACGRFDCFFQGGLSSWDVAAGVLIAQQAGAVLSDYNGGEDYIFGRQIVVSNPHIYDEFIQRLR